MLQKQSLGIVPRAGIDLRCKNSFRLPENARGCFSGQLLEIVAVARKSLPRGSMTLVAGQAEESSYEKH